MAVLFTLLTFIAGFTIPFFPGSSAFVPRLGLTLVKLSHRPLTRLVQAGLVWLFAILTVKSGVGISGWGILALILAVGFTFLAANMYPARIFIAIDNPKRAKQGLADNAPVMAGQAGGETIGYPLETLIPHHIINDTLGGIPVLAAW